MENGLECGFVEKRLNFAKKYSDHFRWFIAGKIYRILFIVYSLLDKLFVQNNIVAPPSLATTPTLLL